MAKHTKHSRATSDPDVRRTRRELQRLEHRLAETRDKEARRARKVEQAAAEGAPRDVASRRAQKLVRAQKRAAALEARIAALQATPADAPPAASADDVVDGPRAYCLRERTTIVIAGPVVVEMRNGRKGVAGTCPSCGVRVVRPA